MKTSNPLINLINSYELSSYEKEVLYIILNELIDKDCVQLEEIKSDLPKNPLTTHPLIPFLKKFQGVYGFIRYDDGFKNIKISPLFEKEIDKNKSYFIELVKYLSEFLNKRL